MYDKPNCGRPQMWNVGREQIKLIVLYPHYNTINGRPLC